MCGELKESLCIQIAQMAFSTINGCAPVLPARPETHTKTIGPSGKRPLCELLSVIYVEGGARPCFP